MPDLVTTSSEGWFSRILGAIKGVLFGLVLLVVAFPLLFMNEGCAVRIAKGLAEGKGMVVSVAANAVQPANEGKLVHLSGRATSQAGVKDDAFGVEAKAALRLEREVEMFQWVEDVETRTEKKLGGGEETRKSYTYEQKWSSESVSSSSFQLKEKDGQPLVNPAMPHREQEFLASDVKVGAFSPNVGLLQQLSGSAVVPPDAAWLAQFPADLRGRARLAGDAVYVGADPSAPQIGDLRIRFKKTDATDVSVIARQTGTTLEPFTTTQNTTLNMLETGTVTAAAMFKNAEDENATRTWFVRFAGFMLMFIGFALVFRPLSVVADVVPFIGGLVGMGTAIVAFAFAAPLSFITIAVAWIVYRPLLGVALLVVGVAVFVGLLRLAQKRKAAR